MDLRTFKEEKPQVKRIENKEDYQEKTLPMLGKNIEYKLEMKIFILIYYIITTKIVGECEWKRKQKIN